jgi:predicted acyltransferase
MTDSVSPQAPASGSSRLMSLDAFRGATIAAMMLVNNPGSWKDVYPPLLHAEWHGWTFTDIVFPFFLWIVGVAIPLSFARRLDQGQDRVQLFSHVVRRSVVLFGLGLFLSLFGYLIDGSISEKGLLAWLQHVAANLRIPGVLQRIAVCYLIASAICLGTRMRGQLLWTGGLLAAYWLAMKLVPVPGYGAGVLDEQGNLSQYLDHLLLGAHVYRGTRIYDPEGIVSTLPAIATCLFGVLTGQLLQSPRSVEEKTAWLFVAGNLLLLAGQVMSLWLPINKKLWTSSYSVFMAGLALNCFAVGYWLIDVKGWKRWAKPLAIYGMNAITVFVLAGILGRLSLEIQMTGAEGKSVTIKTFLYETLLAPLAAGEHPLCSPKFASLLWALGYVVALYLVAWLMYRRRWFLKV